MALATSCEKDIHQESRVMTRGGCIGVNGLGISVQYTSDLISNYGCPRVGLQMGGMTPCCTV